MPLVVACLVPAAPLLLPGLTGDRVPEVGPVREAVGAALTELAGLDRVVVVAPRLPGTLAGFGSCRPPDPLGEHRPPVGSWPHELAAALLDGTAGASTVRSWLDWPLAREDHGPGRDATGDMLAGDLLAGDLLAGDLLVGDLLVGDPGSRHLRTGALLLADGSRTRGPRAPGGEDPAGDEVDAELVAALREGRPPVVPQAAAVGATAAPAVRLLVALGAGRPGAVRVLHDAAPLGVGYLVAVARAGVPLDGP